MHRQPLFDLLSRYQRDFPEELQTVLRIRQLVASREDCFLRTCRPGHVTGSAWVVSPDRRRCLLVHHAKLDRWLQPGGHADGQCDISAVALREVQEETGLGGVELAVSGELVPLDLDVHLIPPRLGAGGEILEDEHEHHDVRFLIIADPEMPLAVSEESHDIRWFTRQELLAATQEHSVLRMMQKAGPE